MAAAASSRDIESRLRFARRTLRKTLSGSAEAQITIALVVIVAGAAGLVASAGYKPMGQAAITLLAGVAGLIAGVLLVFLGLLIIAPAKQRDALHDELQAVKTHHDQEVARLHERIEALEGVAPKPDFGAGRVDPSVTMLDGSQRTYAFGTVFNRKSLPDKGEVAKSAVLRLDFYSPSGVHILGPISGRWRDAPSPSQLPPTQLHTHTEAIDIEPNGALREFDLGLKAPEDQSFCATDSQQKLHPIQNEMTTRVEVRLSGANFADVVATYRVESLGMGGILRVELLGVSFD